MRIPSFETEICVWSVAAPILLWIEVLLHNLFLIKRCVDACFLKPNNFLIYVDNVKRQVFLPNIRNKQNRKQLLCWRHRWPRTRTINKCIFLLDLHYCCYRCSYHSDLRTKPTTLNLWNLCWSSVRLDVAVFGCAP